MMKEPSKEAKQQTYCIVLFRCHMEGGNKQEPEASTVTLALDAMTVRGLAAFKSWQSPTLHLYDGAAKG